MSRIHRSSVIGKPRKNRRFHDQYPDYKFGYEMLIDLRNHEHTILWTKFNYYLLINSIVLVFLSTFFQILASLHGQVIRQ